jgi:hypothetical protein
VICWGRWTEIGDALLRIRSERSLVVDYHSARTREKERRTAVMTALGEGPCQINKCTKKNASCSSTVLRLCECLVKDKRGSASWKRRAPRPLETLVRIGISGVRCFFCGNGCGDWYYPNQITVPMDRNFRANPCLSESLSSLESLPIIINYRLAL